MSFKSVFRGRRLCRTVILGLVLGLTALPAAGQTATGEGEQNAAFQAWLAELKTEALAAGISQATLDEAFVEVEPITRVIELDRRQPEFTQTFWNYLSIAINDERIAQGRNLLKKHDKLLSRLAKRYGVPPRFLIAFWGLESAYGKYTGGFSVVAALSTLAFDTRRSAFFRGELLNALRIIDQGHIPAAEMKGSWAGAMGQLQFMPSTFVHYAVDGDGDGRRNIWSNPTDVFASAANYLSQIGWQRNQTWGREVRLPKNFDLALADLSIQKPISAWRKMGLRRADGRPLPGRDLSASVVLPSGVRGPAFLVYRNFRTIMIWNRSLLYALAVGHMADRLIGAGPLVAKPAPGEKPMHRLEIIELQRLLVSSGFDAGPADGIIGTRTRTAIRAFQLKEKLPADGYPSTAVLQALRQKSGQ